MTGFNTNQVVVMVNGHPRVYDSNTNHGWTNAQGYSCVFENGGWHEHQPRHIPWLNCSMGLSVVFLIVVAIQKIRAG